MGLLASCRPPIELLIQAHNCNLNLQCYQLISACDNYSCVLGKLERKFTDLAIHQPFIMFKLMTIPKEARHSIIIVEGDPTLYEDAAEMTEYVSYAMSNAAKDSAVLLCSPGTAPFLEEPDLVVFS